MRALLNLFTIILSVSFILGKKGFGPTDQEWGFVTLREGAHMFWWLHYTSAKVAEPTSKPLVIWLQGGPGASSTGFGNLGEVGPIDEHLNVRKHAWTNDYNVLFVDNPVGSGFSYVDDNSALVTNNREIADDFLVLLQGFFKQLPKFEDVPLYIFCESYGGKMTAEIGLVLYKAQKSGKIRSNLKGVALGDSWISPVDAVLTWGPYLLNQGLVDVAGFNSIQEVANDTAEAVFKGDYSRATSLWSTLESTVELATSNVDFYNILTKVDEYGNKRKLIKPAGVIDEAAIDRVMNNQVVEALGLDRPWISQNGDVFDALQGDFMRPVTDIVEKLLNETDLEVVVYNGQLDLIVDTPGTIKWVNNLKWYGAEEWNDSDHSPIIVDQIIEGFYKNVGKLTFYWVSRSGHMLPYDNPNAMEYILKKTINIKEESLQSNGI